MASFYDLVEHFVRSSRTIVALTKKHKAKLGEYKIHAVNATLTQLNYLDLCVSFNPNIYNALRQPTQLAHESKDGRAIILGRGTRHHNPDLLRRITGSDSVSILDDNAAFLAFREHIKGCRVINTLKFSHDTGCDVCTYGTNSTFLRARVQKAKRLQKKRKRKSKKIKLPVKRPTPVAVPVNHDYPAHWVVSAHTAQIAEDLHIGMMDGRPIPTQQICRLRVMQWLWHKCVTGSTVNCLLDAIDALYFFGSPGDSHALALLLVEPGKLLHRVMTMRRSISKTCGSSSKQRLNSIGLSRTELDRSVKEIPTVFSRWLWCVGVTHDVAKLGILQGYRSTANRDRSYPLSHRVASRNDRLGTFTDFMETVRAVQLGKEYPVLRTDVDMTRVLRDRHVIAYHKIIYHIRNIANDMEDAYNNLTCDDHCACRRRQVIARKWATSIRGPASGPVLTPAMGASLIKLPTGDINKEWVIRRMTTSIPPAVVVEVLTLLKLYGVAASYRECFKRCKMPCQCGKYPSCSQSICDHAIGISGTNIVAADLVPRRICESDLCPFHTECKVPNYFKSRVTGILTAVGATHVCPSHAKDLATANEYYHRRRAIEAIVPLLGANTIDSVDSTVDHAVFARVYFRKVQVKPAVCTKDVAHFVPSGITSSKAAIKMARARDFVVRGVRNGIPVIGLGLAGMTQKARRKRGSGPRHDMTMEIVKLGQCAFESYRQTTERDRHERDLNKCLRHMCVTVSAYRTQVARLAKSHVGTPIRKLRTLSAVRMTFKPPDSYSVLSSAEYKCFAKYVAGSVVPVSFVFPTVSASFSDDNWRIMSYDRNFLNSTEVRQLAFAYRLGRTYVGLVPWAILFRTRPFMKDALLRHISNIDMHEAITVIKQAVLPQDDNMRAYLLKRPFGTDLIDILVNRA